MQPTQALASPSAEQNRIAQQSSAITAAIPMIAQAGRQKGMSATPLVALVPPTSNATAKTATSVAQGAKQWPNHAGPVTEQDIAALNVQFNTAKDSTIADVAQLLVPSGWRQGKADWDKVRASKGQTVNCSFPFYRGGETINVGSRCAGDGGNDNIVDDINLVTAPGKATAAAVPSQAVALPKAKLNQCDKYAASVDTFAGFAVLHEAGEDEISLAAGRGGVTYQALDANKAIAACQNAVASDANTPRYWFQLGRALEKGNRLPEAIAAYEHAAKLGSPDGMNNLGELYRDGKGVARDLTKAEDYFRKGADGSLEARASLIALLLQTKGSSGYDEALTFARSGLPTGVEISNAIVARVDAAASKIPAVQRNAPSGPDKFAVNISLKITPNQGDSGYCVLAKENRICVPSDQLHIIANNIEFENQAQGELGPLTADLSASVSVELWMLRRPDITQMKYIQNLIVTYSSVLTSDQSPLHIKFTDLRLAVDRCWHSESVSLCVTSK